MFPLFLPRALITRLLHRQLWRYFAAILLILLAILISFRLSNLLSGAAKGEVALAAIMPMVLLQVLRFTVVLAPMAYVLASALVLSNWQEHHENTALLACGVGYGQQLRALLGFALPLAVLLLGAQLYVLPSVYQQQEAQQQRARQDAMLALLTPNSFRSLPDGSVIYAQTLQEDGLQGFFYHQPQADQQRLIFAEAAQFQTQERQMLLQRGIHLQYPTLGQTPYQYASFARATLAFPDPNPAPSQRLRNLYPHQLTENSPAHLGEWQARLNPAISMVLFTFFLPWLARRKPRARTQRTLPIFFLYAFYVTALDLLVAAVKKQQLSAWFASPTLHGLLWLLALWLWLPRQSALDARKLR